MKKVLILMKILGETPDDFDTDDLSSCLYENVMFDIENYDVQEVEFAVKEIEE